MKKVILFVIDALAPRVLEPAMADGSLPHFQQLRAAPSIAHESAPGCYSRSVSVFPSITPVATSSIITGVYPREHGVAGAYWYDQTNDKVYFFGADFWVVLAKGPGEFFRDFLQTLNHRALSAPTLFQTVEKAGLRAASLNYLVFCGQREHQVNIPLLVRLLSGVWRKETVQGPSILCLGDWVDNKLPGVEKKLTRNDGVLNRYGFNDESTADFLLTLIKAKQLPDFTLAYFPDNDFESHETGPQNALSVLKKVDACLEQVIELWGGLETMLREVTVIITGDHSQSDIKPEHDGAAIDLQQTLADYAIVAAGHRWTSEKDLLVCPNLRAAQIYLRQPLKNHAARIAQCLLAEPRIDQVIWRESNRAVFHVATSDRGQLTFCRAARDAKTDLQGATKNQTATDEHGNQWNWDGDLATVDGRLNANKICFGDYPNAWERIESAFLDDKTGDLWVTAHVGHEFFLPGIEVHFNGGSHGSLHTLDSTTSLIVAGAPDGFQFPAHPRIVDVSRMCLEVLGAA